MSTGPASDDIATSWRTITAAVQRTQRRVDRSLEEAGTPPQWVPVLTLLLAADEHRMPMSALAREMSMTTGGFTKLADRMAREGIIDRRGSVSDRRVVHATLTATGRALAETVSTRYAAILHEAIAVVVPAGPLADAAATLAPLRSANAAPVDGEDVVTTERGPVLPDRRGPERRGRGREDT